MGSLAKSDPHVACKVCGGSRDMAIPNLFWKNVQVVSAPPPLYLNFYRKLATTAKPSVEKVVDRYGNCYLWLRRAIPGNLLKVIDHRNIYAAEQIWNGHVPRPIPSIAVQ